MQFQITATKGKQRFRFYVIAGGPKPVQQARDFAEEVLKSQLGIGVKDIERLDVFQVEKIDASGDDPKQGRVPGSGPDAPGPTRHVPGARLLGHDASSTALTVRPGKSRGGKR